MAHPPWMNGVSAFPSPVLQFLFNVIEFIIRPFIFVLTGAAGPFVPTTPERDRPKYLAVQKIVFVPVYTVGVVLLFLPMLIAFLLRNILHQFRRPFCLSVRKDMAVAQPKSTYSVVTGNLCLMPEIFSKYNNLDKTAQRAVKIGERVVIDQMYYTEMMETFLKNHEHTTRNGCINTLGHGRIQTRSMDKSRDLNRSQNIDSEVKVDVIAHFPQLDFLCLQETFDRDYSKLLVAELHKVYPWIVFDVGYNSPRLNYCGLNSGLMFASRYEILDIRFKPFSSRCGFCTIVGKGLLMVKVCVQKKDTGKEVGYVFNTHLQAFQGDNPIVYRQLTEILKWSSEFRAETFEDGDEVLFDMLCGDFNIDNMSPGDVHVSEHELFETYVDVCREKPGKDYDWTVGTELRTPLLHDKAVSTPEGLKAAIEDPYLRQYYLIDADIESATMDSIYNAPLKKDKHGNLILSPVGGRRRIDVVLYRKQSPVMIQNYNIITRLASLTDHIPVSATFTCHH
ncbi:sphingomyelin phosphodiesterase 3-like [Mercenaria mercenaria]|uniref:sphingomyelin phosphodiesterase 3-like n=1 Tax=Mercenaria mercenaria TaxID=6596 RepID=UPI00234F103C|nr:sphingomyelin phosphodiesterase 3-like [Mercenaria mercenaria]